ncbi:MAG: hypothetical protein ACD_36C00082G0001 [uncultured bacterium]|uniref:Amine oxidase domain-containing protein n=1 Tax=Candidatus Gottesmanbacteria bacterium RIFCSPLOWO2_01_FULL_43_11b TaxID=1798392 RepID=A0A1F6AGT3_9BACT|nr:MAG: hypothetical protein ACD_36C00082G0001 [uncultured bacterium]OGG23968.1 MAG: hypothetical protein A3A79_02085 [Candidatus Gottesmanbacteria bacterium RIFCSPLOWO2_01_FULL_43_11b]
MKIAIIGGGFTGLSAAYELTKRGHNVSVFEKEKTLGGLAYGFRQPNWDWHLEGGYHHWFTNDHAMRKLIKELGLYEKLIIKRPITANYYKGKVFQFDSPVHLFTYPYLSPVDKLRTALLLALCKVNPFWKLLENITAKDFFVTIGGKPAWDVLWEPLMYGKFGEYADTIAASWLWARIKKRTQRLMYIAGGFHTVVEALVQAIKKNGGKIIAGKTLTSIPKGFDHTLLTVPTTIAAKLTPDLPIPTIPHLHAQTLILETDKPILKDVYWLNVADRSFPFLAVVAHTNFMHSKYYGNHHITYFGNYLPQGHPYLSMTKEQLLKEFMPYINKISSVQLADQISNFYMFVGPFAQPVHQLHYSRRAPKLTTSDKKIFLTNLDSIYPWDRGTNYAVELGIKAALSMGGSSPAQQTTPHAKYAV